MKQYHSKYISLNIRTLRVKLCIRWRDYSVLVFFTMSFLLPLSSLSASANHVFILIQKGLVSFWLLTLGIDYLTKPCNPTCYPLMNPMAIVPVESLGLAMIQKLQKFCKELGRKKQQTKQKQQQQQKTVPSLVTALPSKPAFLLTYMWGEWKPGTVVCYLD